MAESIKLKKDGREVPVTLREAEEIQRAVRAHRTGPFDAFAVLDAIRVRMSNSTSSGQRARAGV